MASPATDHQRNSPRRLRILLAKPGLDGHDRGVLVIARMLREAGHEVIYGGVRQKPQAIAMAAAQEDADVVGLSILSGSHLTLVEDVVAALAAEDAADIPLIVGGTIPGVDVPKLEALGAAAVFGVGSALDDIRIWLGENL